MEVKRENCSSRGVSPYLCLSERETTPNALHQQLNLAHERVVASRAPSADHERMSVDVTKPTLSSLKDNVLCSAAHALGASTAHVVALKVVNFGLTVGPLDSADHTLASRDQYTRLAATAWPCRLDANWLMMPPAFISFAPSVRSRSVANLHRPTAV